MIIPRDKRNELTEPVKIWLGIWCSWPALRIIKEFSAWRGVGARCIAGVWSWKIACFGEFHRFFGWFHFWKVFFAIAEIPPKKHNIPIWMILDESWKDCLIRKASDRDTENSHGKGSRWEWEDSEFVLHTLHPEPGITVQFAKCSWDAVVWTIVSVVKHCKVWSWVAWCMTARFWSLDDWQFLVVFFYQVFLNQGYRKSLHLCPQPEFYVRLCLLFFLCLKDSQCLFLRVKALTRKRSTVVLLLGH